MPITVGQIELDSPLGLELTRLAGEAKTIVEIGTGSGLGSTQCLLKGMNDGAFLWTLEADLHQFDIAQENLRKSENRNFSCAYGILHRTIRPYFHPVDRVQDREGWEHENKIISNPGIIIWDNLVKLDIDLLFLDGGEFTSDGDFLALWKQAKVIVLDDCSYDKATKNVYASTCLLSAGWEVIRRELSDRNGWAVFRRPQ